MGTLLRAAWSFLVIGFWAFIGFGGTVLGIVTWPQMVLEYTMVGMPLSPGQILGMGVVLIGVWPIMGATGLWLHLSHERPRPVR